MKVKKKNMAIAVCVAVVAVLVISFFCVREGNRKEGEAQGYLTGYTIGYTDQFHGDRQDSQILAGEIVPYEVGSSKWKGFIMAFSRGYDDGYDIAAGE